MPFNVSTFKTQLGNNGYLSPNKFQLLVTPPPILQAQGMISGGNHQSVADIMQQLTFRVDGVTAPSISLNLYDVNRYGVGPIQKIPYNATFNTMSLTFICDGYGDLWKFWNDWMRNIFGFSGTTNGQNGILNDLGSYALSYKSDYSTAITLNAFDSFGEIGQSITYNQAFPYAVNDIQFNWGEDNQVLKVSIAIAFTDFIIIDATTSPNTPGPAPIAPVYK